MAPAASLCPTYIDMPGGDLYDEKQQQELATVASSIRYKEEGRLSLLSTRRASLSKPHQSINIDQYST